MAVGVADADVDGVAIASVTCSAPRAVDRAGLPRRPATARSRRPWPTRAPAVRVRADQRRGEPAAHLARDGDLPRNRPGTRVHGQVAGSPSPRPGRRRRHRAAPPTMAAGRGGSSGMWGKLRGWVEEEPTMTSLRSYVSGAWTEPAEEGRPVLDAVTGEEVARSHRPGSTSPRRWTTAGPPEPGATRADLHQRPGCSRRSAGTARARRAVRSVARTGATLGDAKFDVDGGIASCSATPARQA